LPTPRGAFVTQDSNDAERRAKYKCTHSHCHITKGIRNLLQFKYLNRLYNDFYIYCYPYFTICFGWGHCPSAPPVPAATAQKINSTTIEDGLPTLIHPALPLLAFPVDLAIHNKFNDLPLAPENRIPPGGKVEKLLCHFYDKKNYKIHYKTLKLYKA
jgi:hypothetical protein